MIKKYKIAQTIEINTEYGSIALCLRDKIMERFNIDVDILRASYKIEWDETEIVFGIDGHCFLFVVPAWPEAFDLDKAMDQINAVLNEGQK